MACRQSLSHTWFVADEYREKTLTAYVQNGKNYLWEVSCSSDDGIVGQYETCKRIVDSFQVN